MVIGTTAAILGSAVIAGGATLAASKSSGKAADRATEAQVQANRDSLAQQQQIYDTNKGILSPYVGQGYAANNALAGLLGLQTTDPATGAVTPAGDRGAYQSAFNNYQNSTGYQFRVGEGQRSLNTGYAAKGVLNSGAAQKSLMNYGQNIASDEFARYTAALTGQQQIGLSGASALAGVGQNFANNATAINNSSASAIGNGALAGSAINNNAMTGLAGIAGNAMGALSSYRAPAMGVAPGASGGQFYGQTFNPNTFSGRYGV